MLLRSTKGDAQHVNRTTKSVTIVSSAVVTFIGPKAAEQVGRGCD